MQINNTLDRPEPASLPQFSAVRLTGRSFLVSTVSCPAPVSAKTPFLTAAHKTSAITTVEVTPPSLHHNKPTAEHCKREYVQARRRSCGSSKTMHSLIFLTTMPVEVSTGVAMPYLSLMLYLWRALHSRTTAASLMRGTVTCKTAFQGVSRGNAVLQASITSKLDYRCGTCSNSEVVKPVLRSASEVSGKSS